MSEYLEKICRKGFEAVTKNQALIALLLAILLFIVLVEGWFIYNKLENINIEIYNIEKVLEGK